MSFSRPPTPAPAPVPPPPSRSAQEVQELAAEQRRRFLQRTPGRAATELAGLGTSTGEGAVSRLLGGTSART